MNFEIGMLLVWSVIIVGSVGVFALFCLLLFLIGRDIDDIEGLMDVDEMLDYRELEE